MQPFFDWVSCRHVHVGNEMENEVLSSQGISEKDVSEVSE